LRDASYNGLLPSRGSILHIFLNSTYEQMNKKLRDTLISLILL